MKCPCCRNEMLLTHQHSIQETEGVEARIYHTWFCKSGGNWCNGLIIKHDYYDSKLTYITPAHTCTTLHTNFVTSVEPDDLLKAIFTTFEWCAFKGL